MTQRRRGCVTAKGCSASLIAPRRRRRLYLCWMRSAQSMLVPVAPKTVASGSSGLQKVELQALPCRSMHSSRANIRGTATARLPIGGLLLYLRRDDSSRQGRLIASVGMGAIGADCGLCADPLPVELVSRGGSGGESLHWSLLRGKETYTFLRTCAPTLVTLAFAVDYTKFSVKKPQPTTDKIHLGLLRSPIAVMCLNSHASSISPRR